MVNSVNMPQPAFCLAITVPPPAEERHFVASLQAVFPHVEPGHLAPFLETGDALYLTGQDRPAGQLLADALTDAGLSVRPGDPETPLHRERTIVMPYPGSADQSIIVSLCRESTLPVASVAQVMGTLPVPPATGSQSLGQHCINCGEARAVTLQFCPTCGHTHPQEGSVTAHWRIRLPEDARRSRIIGWLAKAVGKPIPGLNLAGRSELEVQVSVPGETLDAAQARLTGWGAEITYLEAPTNAIPFALTARYASSVCGLFLLTTMLGVHGAVDLSIWLAGLVTTTAYSWPDIRTAYDRRWLIIDPETLTTLANPMPVSLQTDLHKALLDTAGTGLNPVVQKTLREVVGIYQALGSADEISQHLWHSIEPQVTNVATGIVGLVRRGQQLEQFLAAHGSNQLDEEGRRLDRLAARTDDDVARANYEQARQGNAKARKRTHDAVVAGERLASQLLVLMSGLADVHAAVMMGGLRDVGQAGDKAPLVAQLHGLQRDVQAINDALAEFFDS